MRLGFSRLLFLLAASPALSRRLQAPLGQRAEVGMHGRPPSPQLGGSPPREGSNKAEPPLVLLLSGFLGKSVWSGPPPEFLLRRCWLLCEVEQTKLDLERSGLSGLSGGLRDPSGLPGQAQAVCSSDCHEVFKMSLCADCCPQGQRVSS